MIHLFYIVLNVFLITNSFKSQQESHVISAVFIFTDAFAFDTISVTTTQSKLSEFGTNTQKLKMYHIMQLLNGFVNIKIDHIYQITLKYGLNLFSQQAKRPKQIDKLYCCIILYINILVAQQMRDLILCLFCVLIIEMS